MCPQILAAASIGGGTAALVMVFARGTDNNIWYALRDGSGGATTTTWQNLGGGPFLSQPVAATWQQGTWLSVMAVADPDHSVRTRLYTASAAAWTSEAWENLLGQPTTAVNLCVVNSTRLDSWAVESSGAVLHDYWVPAAGDFWSPSQNKGWQATRSFDQAIGARPALACRPDAYYHDMVVYGATDKAVRHTTFSDATGWAPTVTIAGGRQQFQGDPVVLATSSSRIDFFGIGTDGTMYHFSWTKSSGYSVLESLGGSFQSVPSAVVTGADSGSSGVGRIDVVALATNDTLQHRALIDSVWSPWEDLGVFGDSAPLLLNLSSQPEKVAVFVLGLNGELNQTTWTVSSDATWQNLQWSSIGGKFTTSYFGG